MKRIIIMAAALLAAAQLIAQNSYSERYASTEKAETITLTKAQFNLVKPLIGLDKESRRLLKAINLQEFTMIDLSQCDSTIKERAISEFKELHYKDGYKRIDDEDMVFKMEDGVITALLILMARDNDLTLLDIQCRASLSDIEEFGGR